jgi:hypothetical protein
MDWLKKLLATTVWIFISQTLLAQQHYNAWFRSTLSVPVGKKVKIDGEFQHRRQNGFDNANLLDKSLMFTFRNWVYYQHSEDVKFSVSPFAYFSNYKIIQKQTDETEEPNSEIRFSAAVELQHQIFKKIFVVERTGAEYRVFQNNQSNITRLRNRFGLRYDFNERIKLSIFDELFFNIAGVNHSHFFGHDRMGLNLEYKFLPILKFDIGYIHIIRLPVTSSTKLHETTIFLNLTYQIHNRTQTNRAHPIG